MFGLPAAKRVRRSDLYPRSQSASPSPSEPDPELEVQFRARLASIYGPPSNVVPIKASISDANTLNANGDVEDLEDKPKQEFEFRLFSNGSIGRNGEDEKGITQKVILADDEEDIGEGRFVVRERDRGYYFAEKAAGDRRRGFEFMALSGEEVLSRARKRAWGLEVPWRIRVVKVSGKRPSQEAAAQFAAVVGIADDAQVVKKKKPGKKRRIILRERKKTRGKLLEQKKAENDKREEAEREKRTRRNREKKVKRKLREKAKKAGDAVEDSREDIPVPGDSSIAGSGD